MGNPSRETIKSEQEGKGLGAYVAMQVVILVLAVGVIRLLAAQPDLLAYAVGEVNSSFGFGTLDLNTGAYDNVGSSGYLSGLGVGPGGLLYGGAGKTLYQVNSTNGSATSVGTSSITYYAFGSTTNGVYAFDSSLNLYSVNVTNAVTTLIGSTSLPSNGPTAVSTGSSTLYLTTESGDSPSVLYSINTSTGAATEIGSTGVEFIEAMVFENSTLYGVTSGAVYTLNTTTGTATLAASSGGFFNGLAPIGSAASQLTVTTLGTGTGTVTDNLSDIDCTNTAGLQSGTCMYAYDPGTSVTLTATPTPPSTFGGWGGACSGTGSCSLLMNAPYTVTASFVPVPPTAPVPFSCPGGVYPCSNVTPPPAVFNCPSNTNPCTDPNAHSLALTAAQVNAPFTMTVAATEVPTTQADGDCESGQTPSSDFDCRFTSFFPYETLSDGDVIVPACNGYSNGNCVFYSVYFGDKFIEPPTINYVGPIGWAIAWNNTSFLPPPTYPYQTSNPRLYDDPNYEVSTSTPYGTNCSVPMDLDGVPTNPAIYCQYVFDITDYYDLNLAPDPGIGGKTQQFNDVVVAFPLSSAAPNLSASKTADQSQVSAGSPIGYTIGVSNSSAAGTGTATNVAINDPLPAGSSVNWSITPAYTGPGTCAITGSAPSQTLACSLGSLSPAISASVHVGSSNSSDGTYDNTATVSANNNATLTPSASIQVQGGKSAPTVTFTGAPTTAVYNTSFPVTATTNASTTPSITGSGACSAGTVSGTPLSATATVTMTSGNGTCNLTASWASDSNYNSATLYQSTSAQLAPSSTSILSSLPNPSGLRQAVVISFQVTGNGMPTGSVTVSATTGENCSQSLTAGAGSCSIVFTSPGSRSLTATYGGDSNFSGGASSSVAHVVNGRGAIATLHPSSVNFGDLDLNRPSQRFITLTNTGNAPLDIDKIRLSKPGNDLSDFWVVGICPKTLPPSESCTIAVTCFANDSNSSPTATVAISDNAAGSPQLVPLSATVISHGASLSRTSLNFGAEQVNSTSQPQLIALTNTGTSALVLSQVTIGGDFAIAPGTTCKTGATLSPASKCVMNVTFTPSATGERTGSLTIQDNTHKGAQQVTLAGTGD